MRRKSAPASAAKAAWLGVTLDAQANPAGGPVIGEAAGSVSVLALQTNEEYVIARHTRDFV